MFYDKSACSIKPFVCVKTAGTKVWERGCGSGSAALGAYLAYNAGKSVKADITQPGGVITVEANLTDGKVASINIEGKIEIAAYGKALVKL
jgi:diaminopimelate epimerase